MAQPERRPHAFRAREEREITFLAHRAERLIPRCSLEARRRNVSLAGLCLPPGEARGAAASGISVRLLNGSPRGNTRSIASAPPAARRRRRPAPRRRCPSWSPHVPAPRRSWRRPRIDLVREEALKPPGCRRRAFIEPPLRRSLALGRVLAARSRLPSPLRPRPWPNRRPARRGPRSEACRARGD